MNKTSDRLEVKKLKQLKFAQIGYIVISILFYIAGILCLALPDIMAKNAAIAGGIILIIYGGIKITGYFSRDLYCLAFQYDFACGLFLMVLGVIVLCMNEHFKGYLLSGLGLLILLDSLLGIQTAMEARKFGLPSWQVILTASILSGTLGVVLIVINAKAAAGFALLAEGFMRHYIIRSTVKLCPYPQDSEENQNEYEL